MSTTKKYYWFKMKTDFFENMSIKLLKKQKKGDTLILVFQKIILLSLKTDGYLHYKKMMPTFHEELALAINEKPNIIKELLAYLTEYDALERVDENTFFIRLVDDCVGSESKYASLKREERKTINDGHCPTNDRQCPPEKEKETEKEIDTESEKIREEASVSTFPLEKKSGNTPSFHKNNSENKLISSYLNNKAPRNKEMEEYLKKMIGSDLMYTPKNE